jgi:hypothetical protein
MVRNRKDLPEDFDEEKEDQEVDMPSDEEEAEKIDNKVQDKNQVPVTIVEREITLSLINDKLNFIIGLLQKKN